MKTAVIACLAALVLIISVASLVTPAVACDDGPPFIWILRPTPGPDTPALTGAATVEVRAKADLQIKSVDIIVDGKLFATLYQAPYQAVWDTAKAENGEHAIEAKAHLADGTEVAAAVTKVTIDNPAPKDDPAPKEEPAK